MWRMVYRGKPCPNPSLGEDESPPPMASTVITKFLSVSKVFPGPIIASKEWRLPPLPSSKKIAILPPAPALPRGFLATPHSARRAPHSKRDFEQVQNL